MVEPQTLKSFQMMGERAQLAETDITEKEKTADVMITLPMNKDNFIMARLAGKSIIGSIEEETDLNQSDSNDKKE